MDPDPRVPFALDVLGKYALAHTVFAAYEIGLWREFEQVPDREVDVGAFVARNGLEERVTLGVVDHLARHGVLDRLDDGSRRYRLGPQGRHLVEDGWLAYLVYFVGGYGRVLGATTSLADGATRYGEGVVRDVGYVALGTEMMSRTRHHGSYETVLSVAERLRPERVLDVGCGSAHFLVELVNRTRARYGLGVDRSEDACRLARSTVARASCGEVVEIMRCDMHDVVATRPELAAKFDVITAMMVLHESLYAGRSATVALLRALSSLLRAPGGRLLILDKRTDLLEAGEAPPYLTEYKLAHDLTYQDLCTEREWRAIVADAGMAAEGVQRLAHHTGSILLECVAR